MDKVKFKIIKEHNFSKEEIDNIGIDNFFITDSGQLWTPLISKGEIIKTGEQSYNEWLELQNNPVKPEQPLDESTILKENQKEQDNFLIDNAYRIAMLELNTNNML
ncbi:hypothetical protein [Clostridioides sp. GD02404]|uniref:hypothetical protein n=1 Tax=Clostridioides sp. GD02404 TaxID=3054354 RepID=UPI0038AFA185